MFPKSTGGLLVVSKRESWSSLSSRERPDLIQSARGGLHEMVGIFGTQNAHKSIGPGARKPLGQGGVGEAGTLPLTGGCRRPLP